MSDEVLTKNNLSDAVNVFFDRAYECLPAYVSKLPALKISYAVAAGVLLLFTPAIVKQKRSVSDKKDASGVDKMSWVVLLLVSFAFAMAVQGFVMDTVYGIHLIKATKQHVVNVYWLEKYMKAASAAIKTGPF
jgi:hypothetical protein